jgi:hypothetical protein
MLLVSKSLSEEVCRDIRCIERIRTHENSMNERVNVR